MNYTNLEKKILEKISQEKIIPKPMWHFLLRDYSLWLAVLLSTAFTSLSFAPIFFILTNLEPEYVKHLDPKPFFFYLKIFPWPFLVLAIVFSLVAKRAWAKTKSGYKFQGKTIFAFSAFLSITFGLILNILAVGKMVDENFHDPFFNSHKSMSAKMQENWNNPSAGRYFGTVESVATSTFVLQNANAEWQIEYDTDTPGAELVSTSTKLRVVAVNENNAIDACIILPYEMKGFKDGRDGNRNDNKEKIKSSFWKRPEMLRAECKKILEEGRANFRKKVKQK